MNVHFLLGTRRRPDVVAALTMLLLAVGGALFLLGQPLAVFTDRLVLGRGGDPFQTLWRFDGLAHAVAGGSLTVPGDPFRNFGPLPWLPLHWVLGEPLAYNVIWILQAPLAALATFFLARVLGVSRVPSALAGILVAFAPYRVAQSLGHFGAMQVFWIPAVLTCTLLVLRRPTLLRLTGLIALLTGTAWTEHTLFLTTLIALVTCCGVYWRDVWSALTPWRARLAAGIGIAGVVMLGILPFTDEVRRTTAPDSPLTPSVEQRLRFSPTASSLVAWPSFHFTRSATNPYGSAHNTVADRTVALGILTPILALAALLGQRLWRTAPDPSRRGTVLLLLLGIVGVALAMAPRLAPLSLLFDTPPLSTVRVVNRFLVLTAFALPILAARALDRFPRRMTRALIAGVLVLDILPRAPFPTASANFPVVDALRTVRPGPVVVVSAAADDVLASHALYASTQHGHLPIGQGAFARVEEVSTRSNLLRIPVVRDLLLLRSSDLERPTLFGQQPARIAHAALASEDVVAVVLHTRAQNEPVRAFQDGSFAPASEDTLASARSFLRRAGFTEEPLSSQDFLYRVPPWPGTKSQLVAAALDGWERAVRRVDGTVQVALQSGAMLDLHIQGDAQPVTVTFAIPQHAQQTTLTVREADQTLGAWRVIPGTRLVVPLGTLLPGKHLLTFVLDADELVVENPSVLEETP